MIFNQIVTWTAFAILAMFMTKYREQSEPYSLSVFMFSQCHLIQNNGNRKVGGEFLPMDNIG